MRLKRFASCAQILPLGYINDGGVLVSENGSMYRPLMGRKAITQLLGTAAMMSTPHERVFGASTWATLATRVTSLRYGRSTQVRQMRVGNAEAPSVPCA